MASRFESSTNRPNQENKESDDLEISLTETVLALDELDVNLYRGAHLWKHSGGTGVFGGQIVGQALAACSRTKPENAILHSMHSYFIRKGDTNRPILYHVDRLRDGSSFSPRTVRALQGGKVILIMQVSFHKPEEIPIKHQGGMPEVPPPEDLESVVDILRHQLTHEVMTDRRRDKLKALIALDIPLTIKPVDPSKGTGEGESKLRVWFKARGHIGKGNDECLNQCVAAYIGDIVLLRTALVPYNDTFNLTMLASLDHTMWFHTPFRAEDWMLYECECQRLCGSRALVFGRIWSRDGTHAVTLAQEGIIRGKTKSTSKVTK